MQEEVNTKMIKRWIWGIGTFIVFVIILSMNPFTTIEATERGIMLDWGNPQQQLLEPGLHFRTPIKQSVRTVSIQPIQLDHKIEVGKDGAITKDNQTIGSDLTIFYKYKPDQIIKMYKEYGEDKIKSIISQTLRESFKTEIGNYAIFDIPLSQTKIQGNVYKVVVEKMAQYPVDITELKVVNYDWSDEFDKQIQQTMAAAQQVKQKEQELLISQNEQQKKVKEADADKQATVIRAEATRDAAKLEAEAKALEGEGIKKYNESVAKNWDIELKKIELQIAKTKADKWDGHFVPNNMYGPIPVNTTGGVQQ